jgi:hypothetical protein
LWCSHEDGDHQHDQCNQQANDQPFHRGLHLRGGVMTGPCDGALVRANRGSARACAILGKGLHPISAVMRAVRGLWPAKTAAELSARTGAGERMCKYYLAERFALSADALAMLLRSEEGLQILEAAMGDACPSWWIDLKRQVRIADLQRRQRQLRQELDGLTGE